MEIIQTVVREQQCCVDILCDKCGNSCKSVMHSESHFQTEHAELTFEAGYGSKLDGDIWKLHLCEPCFIEAYEFITGTPLDPSKDNHEAVGYAGSIWTGLFRSRAQKANRRQDA